jgi:hypothetical protein
MGFGPVARLGQVERVLCPQTKKTASSALIVPPELPFD